MAPADSTEDSVPKLETSSGSGARSRNKPRFVLRHEGNEYVLGSGTYVIGRGFGCDIVLEKPLMSRRHAQLTVSESEVIVEDLASLNGVYINSVQVERAMCLLPGDELTLGDERLLLVERSTEVGQTGPVLKDVSARPRGMASSSVERAAHPLPAGADALEMIAELVDAAFQLGRAVQAERLLSGHLAVLLERVEAGIKEPPELLERGASYGLRLALATGKSAWAEYALKLYMGSRQPPSTPLIQEFEVVLRQVRGVSVDLLREYVEALLKCADSFDTEQRLSIQRVAGLERLMLL